MDWKCPPRQAIMMWCLAASFIMIQFILQLSVGVISEDLCAELHLDAFALSLLSGAYYVVYVALQSPAGAFVDHFGVRRLLTSGALLAVVGCTLFSQATHLGSAVAGRIFMGTGLAFAFVGTVHVARTWFPLRHQSFMIGIAETVGMSGLFFGNLALKHALVFVTWREFYLYFNALILVLAILVSLFILEEPQDAPSGSPEARGLRVLLRTTRHKIQVIAQQPQVWLIGAYIGLLFAIPTTFAGLWAIPFLGACYDLSPADATFAASLIYLGLAAGAPLLTVCIMHRPQRQGLLMLIPVLIGILLSAIIFGRVPNKKALYIALASIGFLTGGFMSGYAMVGDLFERSLKSAATGFVNTVAVALTPLLSLLIGSILDFCTLPRGAQPCLMHYQGALIVLPLSMLIAAYVGWRTPPPR